MSGVREPFSLRERKVFGQATRGIAGAAIARRLARAGVRGTVIVQLCAFRPTF